MAQKVRVDLLDDYLRRNHLSDSAFSRMLGHSISFVSHIRRRGTCSNSEIKTIAQAIGVSLEEFVIGRENKEMNYNVIEEEDNTTLMDLPFSNLDFIVPKSPDLVISERVATEGRSVIRFTFTEDAMKRMEWNQIRVGVKDKMVFFVKAHAKDEGKFDMSEPLKGFSVIDKPSINRLKPYIGKYYLDYDEKWNFFFTVSEDDYE